MDNWQGDTNAWEDESDATWEAEEVLRLYFIVIHIFINMLFACINYGKNIAIFDTEVTQEQIFMLRRNSNLLLPFPITCTEYLHYD